MLTRQNWSPGLRTSRTVQVQPHVLATASSLGISFTDGHPLLKWTVYHCLILNPSYNIRQCEGTVHWPKRMWLQGDQSEWSVCPGWSATCAPRLQRSVVDIAWVWSEVLKKPILDLGPRLAQNVRREAREPGLHVRGRRCVCRPIRLRLPMCEHNRAHEHEHKHVHCPTQCPCV